MNLNSLVIYVICGKAQAGKDIVASFIQNQKEDSITLSITSPLKDYARKILGWNGSEETKPRDFLQEIGIDIIQNKMHSNLLIDRIIEDIKVMSYYKKHIIISGVRLKKEIETLKKEFPHVICIQVIRPNLDNGLTEKQKNHITEQDLNNYPADYVIINDNDKNHLKESISKIMKEV